MPRRIAVRRHGAIPSPVIPVFPNWAPFNDMLLDGHLKLGEWGVKTRSWQWGYRGPVLLYTSGRVAKPAMKAYGYDPKLCPKKMIIGVGELTDVRELTHAEFRSLFRQFNNVKTEVKASQLIMSGGPYIEPLQFGFFFKDLRRFKEPVPFAWPAGPVKPIYTLVSLVAEALRQVGIDPKKTHLTDRR